MVALFLIVKALTVLGPLLVFLICVCDREDGEAGLRYWSAKVRSWQLEKAREDASREPSI